MNCYNFLIIFGGELVINGWNEFVRLTERAINIFDYCMPSVSLYVVNNVVQVDVELYGEHYNFDA